jgi:hypothetical protein
MAPRRRTMRSLKRTPPTAPHQLSMPLDCVKLRGMSPSERGTVVMRLALLLMEAAGVAGEEHGDDER